jgi:hypothetical protein
MARAALAAIVQNMFGTPALEWRRSAKVFFQKCKVAASERMK